MKIDWFFCGWSRVVHSISHHYMLHRWTYEQLNETVRIYSIYTDLFAAGPSSLTMVGSTTISLGKEEVFRCTSSPCKSPTKVHWRVVNNKGVEVLNILKNTNSTLTEADSGLVMTSYATLFTSTPLSLVTVQCSTRELPLVQDSLSVNIQCKYFMILSE